MKFAIPHFSTKQPLHKVADKFDVIGVFKLLVWCGAEGYVSGLQDAAASCKPGT